MGNGEYVTWEWARDHEARANEGFARLTEAETKLNRAIQDIETERAERLEAAKTDKEERGKMHKENGEKLDKLTARSNILLGIIVTLQFIIGAGIALYAATH